MKQTVIWVDPISSFRCLIRVPLWSHLHPITSYWRQRASLVWLPSSDSYIISGCAVMPPSGDRKWHRTPSCGVQNMWHFSAVACSCSLLLAASIWVVFYSHPPTVSWQKEEESVNLLTDNKLVLVKAGAVNINDVLLCRAVTSYSQVHKKNSAT